MDYIYLIVSAIIVLICFYLIVSPFFKTEGTVARAGKKGEPDEAVTLETVYKAANELEMDFLMKKMTEQDFLQLKEQYQMLAADLIRQEKKQAASKVDKKDKQDKEIELEILAELQNLRKQKGR